jgi:hypothetical protein
MPQEVLAAEKDVALENIRATPAKRDKGVVVQFSLSREMTAVLDELCEKSESTRADICRWAVRHALLKHRNRWKE